MKRTNILRSILLYLLMPEDTTEAGSSDTFLQNQVSRELTWLGPLKTVFWFIIAVAGPLLLCALLV